MAKQLISGLILEYFPQICRLKFFVIVLPLLVVKLCSKFVPNFVPMQFKTKLMSHTWGNNEKLNLGSNLDLFGPNLGPIVFVVSFTSNSSKILFQPIILRYWKENEWTKLKKMAKKLILGSILACLPQIWTPKKFFLNFIFRSI